MARTLTRRAFLARFVMHGRIKGPRLFPAPAGSSPEPRSIVGIASDEHHSFHDFPHRVVFPESGN